MDNIDMKQIQWFPGHMAKTRRLIASNLSLVDAVVEIVDARLPLSSQNPEMDKMTKGKPRIVILNKSDLADERTTQLWIDHFRANGKEAVAIDCKSGRGLKNIIPTIRKTILKELMEKRQKNGMSTSSVRLMIVGIPNVGKSSLINKMAGSKRAKVEDRPGVTRTKQWVKLDNNTELLDMPGVLWPKFEDQSIAVRLAFTGAISDDILDIETLAMKLLVYLAENYSDSLKERYKIELTGEEDGFELLEAIGKKRGMMIAGGEVNTERAAIMILDEFRSGKLGKITLEAPPREEKLCQE
ncbi:ribosome biogenesis GTPase YlqF [uncultured Ruminococcus sp.]|uniref:ribosome biogenesis GTPase YlqF n=1 Tax=uncultured Ruminococcus sp. TaxID=165186 RepID=UPI0025E00E71|nr:ribosome biogenesis GTPase YlqF [uncultured Ruminococcus sp.]